MLVTTTSTLDNAKVVKYIGPVSGEAILGANIFRDLFAGIRDIVGGRSAAYESELRKAKDLAVQEMQHQAAGLGANAIIGMRYDANEVMPPHRHSPNAIRFGLTGTGNFTGVGGEDITFGPGDMVLTPVDTWHNHGNVGNEPAINLSVLDLPLVETLNAVYFEHDYTEMVEGKPVRKKQQTATVPSETR